ncbi:MAG: hypothetical protein M1821_002121 [Bathelium mastoideum]|nr:MAG: hypothetical protein M1821_002121 [Bathelium mastoideum]KAI9684991.1 MAG: hypothetical protein M1822_005383 [Bathelium mastoideum]
MADEGDTTATTYEQLASIEEEFDDVDTEILRLQYKLSQPLYRQRHEIISRMNHAERFWPLVFEQAPLEVEAFIKPSDSELFSEALRGFDVTRFDLEGGAEGSQQSGEPRSLLFKFEFKDNRWFEDSVLEKKIWYRHAKDGWAGLVSEPVKIHWKKGKDLTQGLTDDALALFEARQESGDMMKQELPQYKALTKKVESWNGANTSFFTWFGWVSSRRYVGLEESEQSTKEAAERRRKRKGGEKIDDPRSSESVTDEDAEVHPSGEELALALAEELWPTATKLFTQAQEVQDDEMSEADFEDDDVDEEEEEEDEDDGDDDVAKDTVDIRSLVKGKKKHEGNGGPPKKKQKN